MVSANYLLQLGIKDMIEYYQLVIAKVDEVKKEEAERLIERMSLIQMAGLIRYVNAVVTDDPADNTNYQRVLLLVKRFRTR